MSAMSGTQKSESVGCSARSLMSRLHLIWDGSAQVGCVTLKKTEKDA
jgi:hypothetical protein